MKRENRLIERIADPDNLRLAFWKASRSKNAKAEVVQFRDALDKNLLSLRNEILCGQVDVGHYRYFKIYDPKERLICASAFRERVLHHALMNICHDSFDRFQIFDSYACRIGKGTYAALDRAKSFQRKYAWFLKLDVRKYFYTISHDLLKQHLQCRFKEVQLLHIFDSIIDSYGVSPGRGIPIGNLTSQYFANHYLAFADRYVKEYLHIPAYVRYMDDMVLWSNDKVHLIEAGKRLKQFIEETLRLALKPFCLNHTDKGLPFLGYLLYPHKTWLGRTSRLRFREKCTVYSYQLAQEKWTQAEYQRHIFPLLAFTLYADTRAWRNMLLNTNRCET